MPRTRALRVALVVALGLGSSCSSSSNFSSEPPLPLERADHAAVSLDGSLYVLGGFSGSTVARVDRYDPAANSWTQVADMNTARREFAAGVVNGKIYVACGMDWSDPNVVTYVNTTEVFDPATNTWSDLAPCPIVPGENGVYSNIHIGGAVANGQLYVAVFDDFTSSGTATMYAYNPTTDTWATRSPPPFTYSRYSVTELGGQLYLLANGNSVESLFAQYDPSSDVWALLLSLSGVWSATLVSFDGQIFAVGGAVPEFGQVLLPMTPVSSVYAYDPSTNSWSISGLLRVPRFATAAAAVGTELYVAGGSSATEDQWDLIPLAEVEASARP